MICYVILHYQAIEETKKCIKSIEKNTTSDYKVIIVDNASPNKSGMILEKEYAENNNIDIIISNNNLGFAKGNNLGYKLAKKYDPDYIIILNSDIVISQEDFCSRIDYAYNKYNFDVLGPDIYSTKMKYHQNPQRENNFTINELLKKERNLYFKNRFKFLLKIKYSFLHNNAKDDVHQNNYKDVQIGKVLHGACYIFSKKFINKYDECFYPGTFMYYESYILHYLGMKDDLVFLYYPDIVVYHQEDASTNETYNNQYKKSVFVNKCLLDSCREYIKLIRNESCHRG